MNRPTQLHLFVLRRSAALLVLASIGLAESALAVQTIDVSPPSLAFPDRMIGESSPEFDVVITNTGIELVVISDIRKVGAHPGDFPISLRFCPSLRLQPGEVCRVVVQFTPLASGARSATLRVESNAQGTPHDVSLTGTGLSPGPRLYVAYGDVISFDPQPVASTSGDKTILLSNKGLTDLHISSIVITGSHPTDFQKNPHCDTATLTPGNPNQNCSFGVRFAPKAGGARTAQVVISSDDPTAPNGQRIIALGGTGLVPAISFTPAPLEFGLVDLGNHRVLRLTITNNGNAQLIVTGVSLNANAGDFHAPSSYNCTAGPRDSCFVDLTFIPRASGLREARLQVTSNAPGTNEALLRGTGRMLAAPPAPVAPDDHTFVTSTVAPAGECLVGTQGPITLSVPITRVIGPVGASGTRAEAIASGALSAEATLEIAAYNVKATTDHRVTLNGVQVGSLRGVGNTWYVTSLKIPIARLRFPAQGTVAPPFPKPTARANSISIAIDANNMTACTAVAWARIRFLAISPVILVHGDGQSGAFFVRRGFAGSLAAAGIPFDMTISLAAGTGGSASIASNARELDSLLPGIVRTFGVNSVHVVAHSKGGLDMRSWLGTFAASRATGDSAFNVLSLTTLGTPHRGSAAADAAMAVCAIGLTTMLIPVTVATFVPDCVTSTPDLTTSSTAGFAPTLPSGADYRMLGAIADANGNNIIDRITVDEYAAARAENTLLAATFMSDPIKGPLQADVMINAVYHWLLTTQSVRIFAQTLPSPFPPYTVTVSHPIAVPGGAPNDFLVTILSATGAPGPFVPLSTGVVLADHASVASGAIAGMVLPFLTATDRARGDLR